MKIFKFLPRRLVFCVGECLYYGMNGRKRVDMLKKVWSILKGIFLALLVMFAIDVAFFSRSISPPIATYALRFSGFIPRYSKVMEVSVESNRKIVPCSIYRRDGSPFLLLGPYPFLKEQSDFFFVTKDFVQVRFLDEKTDDWTRIFKWVWIDQDMDPNGRDLLFSHMRSPQEVVKLGCAFR